MKRIEDKKSLSSIKRDKTKFRVIPCGTILVTKYFPKCRIYTFKVEEITSCG